LQMAEDRYRFENAVEHVNYWTERIHETERELADRYRLYFADYFTARNGMFDEIAAGSPLNNEGIAEYAEAVMRLDGASPKEAAAHAEALLPVFSPDSHDKPTPILFDVEGSGYKTNMLLAITEGTFTGDNYLSRQPSFILHKNEALRDTNMLTVSGKLDATVYLHGRHSLDGSSYDHVFWGAGSSGKVHFDLRKLKVINDPEAVERAMDEREAQSVFLGEAAIEGVRRHFKYEEEPHVNAMVRALEARGISIENIELGEDKQVKDTASFVRAFLKKYIPVAGRNRHGSQELRDAGIPVVLLPGYLRGVLSPDEIDDAIIDGFAEIGSVITDEQKATIEERINSGVALRLGSFVAEAAREHATEVAEVLMGIDEGAMYRQHLVLDPDKIAERVRSDRALFKKLTVPEQPYSWASPIPKDSPAEAALRKYSKTGTFKKRTA
jgi:hypothetical protein